MTERIVAELACTQELLRHIAGDPAMPEWLRAACAERLRRIDDALAGAPDATFTNFAQRVAGGPRRAGPSRLLLRGETGARRGARKAHWVIKDRGREYSTGYGETERARADAALATYISALRSVPVPRQTGDGPPFGANKREQNGAISPNDHRNH